MSEEENTQTIEGMYNPVTAPYYDMIKDIHVMLVNHEKEFNTEMVDLLKSYRYKVTTVDTAPTAISMLSKGKEKIDVMIINVHLPDLLSFKLLAQAVTLDIVSLFVCDEHNALSATKALNDGAYLYLKKSLDEEIVQYLWQFVLRKKIQREKAKNKLEQNGDQMNVGDVDDINIIRDIEQAGEKNDEPNTEKQSNNIHEAEKSVASNEKYKLTRKRGRNSTKDTDEGESQNNAINKTVRRKACIEWTLDLHTKFMEAVEQLGEGRCYPKEILEVMNVPGLMRMQVASHLQKCRRNNWRSPEERKSIRRPLGQESLSGSQQRSGFRKFGTMPRLQINISNLQQQQRNTDQIRRGLELSFSPLQTNNIFDRGESSTQQQLYRPQLQVQPHYLSIGNSFNNSSLSAQNYIGSGIQQHHEPLFGVLHSQGLQDPIIESTNYRSGLTINNGDHHTHNDYNLDLNAAHVTTYSGSAIMSDTYIKNATINEVGTTNANIQQYIGESNMSDPINMITTSHASDTEGSDSNEREKCDTYFNFNNMDYLFQNLGSPIANLPNEYGSEFAQVYSDDQVTSRPSVHFPKITNFFDEST